MGLLDFVYPENIYCICCGDTIDSSRLDGICSSCEEKIQWSTDNPFESHMEDFSFESVMPCAIYSFHVRQIMQGLKLSAKPYIARDLGRLMGERVKIENENLGGDLCEAVMIAVPMHSTKLEKRGYNQAELLAGYAAKECGLQYWPGAMVKLEATKSMRLSDAIERRMLMENTFGINEKYCDKIKNKDIILVDDVCTTGSTADACSSVLKRAGAASVRVLCFASATH